MEHVPAVRTCTLELMTEQTDGVSDVKVIVRAEPLEALAFGVPVVASRAGAAAEILDAGRAGLLLESISVDHLRDAMNSVLNHPADAASRTAHGRRQIEAHYHLETNSRRLAELLRTSAP